MEQIIISRNPQVRKIIEGRANMELLNLLLQKQLDFTDEEYLECFAFALTYEDLYEDARMRLQQIPEAVKKKYVQKRDANERVVRSIVDEAISEANVSLLTALAQSRWTAEEFLLRIAARSPVSVLEVMAENPLPLVATPEIMEKILQNPNANDQVRQKVGEIKELFFVEEKKEVKAEPVSVSTVSQAPDSEAAGAKEDQNASADGQQGNQTIQVVEEGKTLYQKISTMAVAEKIRLAFKGSKSERLILMKDPNRVVQNAVVDSPKLSEDEVVYIANDRSVPADIISKIADSREWTSIYPVVMALVQNPKVPVNKALAFLKQLHERDLKALVLDKNINPTVRQLALSYYKTRHDGK